MIEVAKDIKTDNVRVSFSIRDTLWEELQLTKSWKNVELFMCDGYVQKSDFAEKMNPNGTVIASDGRITRICVGGKEYADGITGVEFSHRVGTLSPHFEITAGTVNLCAKESLDDFREFLRNLMGIGV